MYTMVIVLLLSGANMSPTAVTIEGYTSYENCKNIGVPEVKKRYAMSSVQVKSAECFLVK
ncbi:hypothetical protein [Yersinia phage fHe-Yen9-04]|uniref:Uncharacterized protein n=2 Tax=Eneladusvirus Yen904 TaxID=2560849 RepID=A0A2C9CXR4_9CAUD|nr:hypothetical protein FDJ41_gp343 [Yersinia phage fHe-Yen9-04]SOK58620.1 hypothetical protein [Yersinia phage fHe-Yen9-04]SOK59154.1 hypothetical protein [Yersinia phage fHe-Yen9-03]VUE36389.1 hypothetical protein [Yersinia phage fHe-Yen9-04]